MATIESTDLGKPQTPELRARFPRVPGRVHFLGAGGAGVSGAVRILFEHGHGVSGHDREGSEHVELLRALGIRVGVDRHSALPLPADCELVVRSAAVPADDACLRAAAERGVPVIKYGELLERIMPEQRTLAIAGTHGKTTTAWMTYHALRGLCASACGPAAYPGALIGGICRRTGSNAVAAEPGGWLAVEACEYDRTFLRLAPRGASIGNVEPDHLDYYGDFRSILEAFSRFADRVHPDGLLVLGARVPPMVEHAARCRVWRYGRDFHSDLLAHQRGRFTFRLRGPGFQTPPIALAVPGEFNVENASLAIALVITTAEEGEGRQLAAVAAARTLEQFVGSKRRFEPWGTDGGVEVVHDYAHHPTEVRVTLETARRVLPGRPLHVLFQPHQHSRTARFLEDFVESLRFADRVVVADVYGARRHIDGGHLAGAPELVDGLTARGVDAALGGNLSDSVRRFARDLPERCCALVLGAGDVEQAKHELLDQLAVRSAALGRARR
jgi:UDP-N-acetylmuramate--alanine ligase